MEPVYFVMAILGCSDDGMSCQQARVEPARYESAAKCNAAMGGVLPRHADLDFPVVGASCQAKSGRFAENRPVSRPAVRPGS
ncbi:hypothetical protein P1X14_19980 [Sphingomonas sp. AOB5]|uniref:hypothetical protein n=1 Tax=Sphingomonas sp. AOB5 TaxID=3034017 RepID=UPI0023F64251|nr:hypothetical protein [Sphingomonas sp. AOB5]MDF7777545.1 hypothetical protein [Sphingomonas sp. AOB5]